MQGSPDPAHLVIYSCNPLTTLFLWSNFMHVYKKVVSIEGSLSSSGWSLLPRVETSAKLLLASKHVSFEPFHLPWLASPYPPCGHAISRYHVHAGVFLAWFKPHHLDVLRHHRLCYPFLMDLRYQCGKIYHFMIELLVEGAQYSGYVITISCVVPWSSAVVTDWLPMAHS